jgi:hypothetical protein
MQLKGHFPKPSNNDLKGKRKGMDPSNHEDFPVTLRCDLIQNCRGSCPGSSKSISIDFQKRLNKIKLQEVAQETPRTHPIDLNREELDNK